MHHHSVHPAISMASSTQQQTSPIIALIGNPGAGKSTTLNGLVGRHIFRSGTTSEPRITKKLDFYQSSVSPISVCDTPGLLGVRDTPAAAKEIDTLLSKRQDIFIIFVVKLDDGRPRQSDAVMIQAVLSAIGGDLTNRFGVMVNMVSEDTMRLLEANEKSAAMHMREKLTGAFRTRHWLYVPNFEKLSGKRNRMLKFDQLTVFLTAMYGNGNGTHPAKEKGKQVKPIDVRGVQKMGREYEARLRIMEERSSEETQRAQQRFEEEVRTHEEDCKRAKRYAEKAAKEIKEERSKLMEEMEKVSEYSAKTEKKAKVYTKRNLGKMAGAFGVASGAGVILAGALTLNPLAVVAGGGALAAGAAGLCLGKKQSRDEISES